MKYELVKIEELCGDKATIYSVFVGDEKNTLFDSFLEQYESSHKSEINYILDRLEKVGKETGYRESFFKQKEDLNGNLIEAIYDKPNSHLRLFCINLGRTILIIGNGGYKSKNIRAWQESEELTSKNYLLQDISTELNKKIMDREIYYSSDRMELLGDLIFGDENE